MDGESGSGELGNKNKTAWQFRLKRETLLIVCIFIISTTQEGTTTGRSIQRGHTEYP